MSKVPRKPNPDRLKRQAFHHLERWPTTRANLRRVLRRKVARAVPHHVFEVEEAHAWIEAVLDDLERIGVLNDTRWALDKARSGIRKGQSPRQVRANLRAKGIAPELVEQALDAVEGDTELRAAVTYARKRRLGPFAPPGRSPEQRTKDLARLARRGFSYDVARRVLDAEDPEALTSS